VKLETTHHRIIVSDVKESVHYTSYKSEENKFLIFADDSATRWMTCSTVVDFDTVVGGDKFGNFFANRIPSNTLEEVEEDPSGTRMIYQRGYLQGALFKVRNSNK
jgi:splicing factor 3B subunit 3